MCTCQHRLEYLRFKNKDTQHKGLLSLSETCLQERILNSTAIIGASECLTLFSRRELSNYNDFFFFNHFCIVRERNKTAAVLPVRLLMALGYVVTL